MTISNHLSDYFLGAAGKRLSAVEASRSASNQHEFNGVHNLTQLLGEPVGSERYLTTFIYVNDDLDVTVTTSTLTWYDARRRGREERGVMRWEYRLYYPSNEAMDLAKAGDFMLLARPTKANEDDLGQRMVVFIAPSDSSVAIQLRVLFGLPGLADTRFEVNPEPQDADLDFTSRALLEALGYEVGEIREDLLEVLLRQFDDDFPTTLEFSAFARQLTGEVDGITDPDGTLVRWMEQEEAMFRTLERHHVERSLAAVSGDVDATLAVAMRAFQRRKSRAGHALENHISEIFRLHGVRFERGVTTEGRKRPDFLLPGQSCYLDPAFPDSALRMLGAKTTCKDRWRQVLSEADRIDLKHLLTLESPISEPQTDEMAAQGLQLVVPSPLQATYTPTQQQWLVSLSQFMAETKQLLGRTTQ